MLFILKVYGSLFLNKFNIIDDNTWCYIHYVGTCVMFCSFFYLLKDRMHSFIYSLGMSIFVSRLMTQLFSEGMEYWYEMISVIFFTCIFYLISKYLKERKK